MGEWYTCLRIKQSRNKNAATEASMLTALPDNFRTLILTRMKTIPAAITRDHNGWK